MIVVAKMNSTIVHREASLVDPRALTVQQWRVLEMTVAGSTLQEMATEFGYASRSGALALQRVALKAYATAVGDDIDEWRARLTSKLLHMLETLAPAVEQGGVQATKVSNEVAKTLADMYGLRKPLRVEVDAMVMAFNEVTDAERAERVAKLITSRAIGGGRPGVVGSPTDPGALDPTQG